MYNEAELKKMSNAALNRIIIEINTQIKGKGEKRPRLKKGGNKSAKIARILGYYAPKVKTPIEETEPEEEEEEEEEPEVVNVEMVEEIAPTPPVVTPPSPSPPPISDQQRLYSELFSLPSKIPEVREVTSSMSDGFLKDRDFVRWCYIKILGREPDPVGWDVYCGHLKSKTLNRAGLVQALFASDEFRYKRDTGFFSNQRTG